MAVHPTVPVDLVDLVDPAVPEVPAALMDGVGPVEGQVASTAFNKRFAALVTHCLRLDPASSRSIPGRPSRRRR